MSTVWSFWTSHPWKQTVKERSSYNWLWFSQRARILLNNRSKDCIWNSKAYWVPLGIPIFIPYKEHCELIRKDNKKCAKGLNRLLTKEDIQMANINHEKSWFPLLVIKEVQITPWCDVNTHPPEWLKGNKTK